MRQDMWKSSCRGSIHFSDDPIHSFPSLDAAVAAHGFQCLPWIRPAAGVLGVMLDPRCLRPRLLLASSLKFVSYCWLCSWSRVTGNWPLQQGILEWPCGKANCLLLIFFVKLWFPESATWSERLRYWPCQTCQKESEMGGKVEFHFRKANV